MSILGSYAFGGPPLFATPILNPQPPTHRNALGKPLDMLLGSLTPPYRFPLMQAFESLQSLDDHILSLCSTHDSSPLDDQSRIDVIVYPVVKQFMFCRAPGEDSLHERAMFSCLRAGALLYLAELRRRSGISPVRITYQLTLLVDAIAAIEDHPDLTPVMHLWLLTVGALEATIPADQHFFLCRIRGLKSELMIEHISQYREYLREVVWLDTLLEPRFSSLFSLL